MVLLLLLGTSSLRQLVTSVLSCSFVPAASQQELLDHTLAGLAPYFTDLLTAAALHPLPSPHHNPTPSPSPSPGQPAVRPFLPVQSHLAGLDSDAGSGADRLLAMYTPCSTCARTLPSVHRRSLSSCKPPCSLPALGHLWLGVVSMVVVGMRRRGGGEGASGCSVVREAVSGVADQDPGPAGRPQCKAGG